MSLAGLEDFSEEPEAYNVLSDELLDKILVAVIQSKDPETGIISVILYDTSTDDDINLNDTILDQIYEKYMPQLPQVSVF